MAFKRTKQFLGYGINGVLRDVAPNPICSQRAPTTTDLAQIGSIWIDMPNNAWFVLTSVVANSASWVGQSSGSGTFATLTVTGNSDQQGNVDVGGALAVTGTTTLANTNIVGDFTLTGDFDITDTAAISLTSTFDGPEAIYLHANGGVSEQIRIHSDQGTSVNSVEIDSDAGGITLVAGLATADAINLNATGGGVDIDGVLQVNIASSQAAATAISLDASNAAGGITMAAGTGGILMGNQADCTTIDVGDIAPTASRTITVGGGTVATASVTDTIDIGPDAASTNADSIKVVNIATGNVATGQNNVNINTGTAASGSQTTNISTGTGGGTKAVNIGNADGLTTLNIDAITLINDSVNVDTAINTGTSTGKVDIGNAAGGSITLSSAANSSFSTAGAGIDLTLSSAAGRVIVNAEEAASNAITLLSAAGGIDADAALQVNIASSQNAADAIVMNASGGGINITAAGAAGEDLDLSCTSGSVNIAAGESAADSIVINSDAGGIDILANGAAAGEDIDISASSSINITSTENDVGAIYLRAAGGILERIRLNSTLGTQADSVLLESDVGGITLIADALASADAININAVAGGVDIDGALQVNIASSQNAADAIRLNATAGGIDVDANGAAGEDITITNTGGSIVLSATESAADAIVLDSTAGGINIFANGAAPGEDINISASSSININSTENNSQALYLHANAGVSEGIDIHSDQGTSDISVNLRSDVGGITLNSGIGAVLMTPQTAAFAGTSLTLNARVGVATFTGQTTGAGSTVDLTITNSEVTQGQGVFCTVSNTGSNDADITMEGCITETAGTLLVRCQNNGAAALNGNIIVTFWLIN